MLGDLNNKEIIDFLKAENLGRIGVSLNDDTYIVPITFIYDDNFIIGHTRTGKKVDMMRKNPNVCFEADRMENLSNWKSVIIRGVYEELEGDIANAAFQKFFNRIKPLLPGITTHPHEQIKKTRTTDISKKTHSVIFRIRIIEKTGRFEKSDYQKER